MSVIIEVEADHQSNVAYVAVKTINKKTGAYETERFQFDRKDPNQKILVAILNDKDIVSYNDYKDGKSIYHLGYVTKNL